MSWPKSSPVSAHPRYALMEKHISYHLRPGANPWSPSWDHRQFNPSYSTPVTVNMHLSTLLLTCLSLPVIHATNIPSSSIQPRKDSACPEVWTQVKAELNTLFMSGYECNGLARAAIRAVFHDCGSWDTSQGLTGGCDGSLAVGATPDVELDRPENRGLQTIAATLKNLAGKYGTSVADMVVFAGNAAIVLCPGGPRVKTFIGRKDSTTSAPPGGLPNVFDSAANLASLFAQKGLDAEDLAALLGAHSTSTQKFVDPSQANKSQDSTSMGRHLLRANVRLRHHGKEGSEYLCLSLRTRSWRHMVTWGRSSRGSLGIRGSGPVNSRTRKSLCAQCQVRDAYHM
ncbi:heme peroxidase [Coniochaeta sp. 2T2.1]|nr:heme peroxidase [Coniochaeta sp. 2T2.1]